MRKICLICLVTQEKRVGGDKFYPHTFLLKECLKTLRSLERLEQIRYWNSYSCQITRLSNDHASLSGEKFQFIEIRFRVSRYALIDTSTFGGWPRQKRLEMGLKQKELAVEIGVSKDTVRNWEKGRCRPSKESLEKIYDVLSWIIFAGIYCLKNKNDEIMLDYKEYLS